MTTETIPNTTKTFKYSFPTCTNEELRFNLEVPVEIPHAGSTRELVQRIINMFHIPVYLEDELNERLAQFVSEETKNFHNERDEKLINQLKNSELNVESIVKKWEKMFKENVVEFAEQKGTPDEEVFAAAYHKLVHSPALETILQVENSYAKTVMTTLKNRDEDIRKLTEKQTEEMEEKLRNLHVSCTEEEINELATQQFEAQAVVAGRWGSTLDALYHAQRAHHRSWLMATLDHYQASAALHTPTNSPLGTFSAAGMGAAELLVAEPPATDPGGRARLEESFTIHLGSQLKQTHNIRLVALDPADLCYLDHHNPAEWRRRLQTSLSLYSGELAALVLPAHAEPALAAHALAPAHCSTEHHFPDVEQQLREITERLKEPVEARNQQRRQHQQQQQQQQQQGQAAGGKWGAHSNRLQPGDVFVTRHTNLADVHLVFHLVLTDENHRSGDITSRHPGILGLRNVLKAAAANDVTSLTLPLLLRYDLSEETTAAWCLRRAELVLKCVKGFMLEAGGWGGAELRTLTVAAPPDTAPELFASLAALLPSIFRLSNPVKYKPPGPDSI